MEINKEKILKLRYRNMLNLFNFGLYLPENRKNERLNFINLNGNYYFCKLMKDCNLLLNELIGTYFSNLIGLDSVKNEVAFYKYSFFIISKSFYKKGYEYYFSYNLKDYYKNSEYLDKNFIKIKSDKYARLSKLEEVFGTKMLNDLLKLIVLDLKMGQVDRNAWNLTFCKNISSREYSLSPVYDFELSYQSDRPYNYVWYENPFLSIMRNEDELKELTDIYPFIIDTVNILKYTSIEDVLKIITRENGIKLSEDELNYYKYWDKELTKVFKRI